MGALVDILRVSSGTVRELAWVLTVASVGLLLAAAVAFSPWYPRAAGVEPEPSPGGHGTTAQLVKMRTSRTAVPPGWAITGLRSSSRIRRWRSATSPTATTSDTSASTSAAGVPR
jgi:hypothetical protein